MTTESKPGLSTPASVELTIPGFRPPGESPEREDASPRLPRISRLMALAIKLQDMVDRGDVRDYAELACVGYVTRARITQIMNLLLLAPDIQEHLLFLVATPGTLRATERELRTVATRISWEEQRKFWNGLAG